MIAYHVDYSDDKVREMFRRLEDDMPVINRRILGVLASEVVTRSVKGYVVPNFRHPTGNLARSIGFKVEDSFAEVGTNISYGAYHEFGFRGVANVRGHMRRGHQVRAHTRNVNYAGRPYLRPALDDIFGTGRAVQVIKTVLEDEIKKRETA